MYGKSRTRTFAPLAASALILAVLSTFAGCRSSRADSDPLPSWNDGAAKQAIVDFVREATTPGGAKFLTPDARIATFDNDGTLWVEKPMYTQVTFAIDRVEALAPQHPEWKEQPPLCAILEHDQAAIAKLTIQDIEKIIAATHSGMTTGEFEKIVDGWLGTNKHPRLKRRYTELVYEPMLELMKYLRANGFKTYIATGGGQDFVRVFSARVYGVVAEQVIGSAGKVKYEERNGKPVLVKLPEALLVDDKAGKPEAIHLIIGQRPSAAFGNSTGDQEMLEFAGGASSLEMLVHHDDADREYAYGPESKVGTFSDALRDEANQRGWTIISMKRDWKRIFPFEH